MVNRVRMGEMGKMALMVRMGETEKMGWMANLELAYQARVVRVVCPAEGALPAQDIYLLRLISKKTPNWKMTLKTHNKFVFLIFA
jgi:hypothetical protein